jgi:fatty-acyl-CoA synthase
VVDIAAQPSLDALVNTARRNALGDLLRRTAARYPDKLAVVADGRSQTFAEFNGSVNRLAASIAQAGVSPGDRLAVLSHNCWEYAALTFAAAKLGVILVPINFMLSPAEVAFILDHSGAQNLVVEDALAPTGAQALELAGTATGLRG